MLTALFIRDHPPRPVRRPWASVLNELTQPSNAANDRCSSNAQPRIGAGDSRVDTRMEDDNVESTADNTGPIGNQDDKNTSGSQRAAPSGATAGGRTEDKDTSINTAGAPPSPSSSAARFTFAELPAELQDAIWTACLPRRVVEVCPHAGHALSPATELTAQRRQPARAATTVPNYASAWQSQNRKREAAPSRPPRPLAEVCYQARVVALRHGTWKSGAEGMPVWFDADRDTILLNGERLADYVLLEEEEGDSEEETEELETTDPHGGVPSREKPPKTTAQLAGARTADGREPRYRQQLVGCLDLAAGGVAVSHEVLQSHLGRVVFPLLARFSRRAEDGGSGGMRGPIMVFFDDVCLTGTRAQAIASGLFGPSVEESRFFVPLDDVDTLRRIRDMDQSNGPAGAGRTTMPGVLRDNNGNNDSANRNKGLRIGNAGFFRGLLRRSHAAQNQRLLEEYFMRSRGRRYPPMDANDEAILSNMPFFTQVVMFRFSEERSGN